MDDDEEIKDNPDDWGVRVKDSEDYKNTSNYVSTIRNPSFGHNSSEILPMNQSIQDVEMNDDQE
jgi:hypothetical protein